MLRSTLPSVLFGVVLATSAPCAADVLVVAPSGAPYTEIQAAIDVAQDGDVVLVKAGTYASFVIRNRELAVVADAGAVVNVDGAIRVSGLTVTRSVLLSGLRATGTATSNPQSRHGLFARNCSGSLRVVGCTLTGVPLSVGVTFLGFQGNYGFVLPACYEGQGAQIEGCADVAFVASALRGSDATPTTGYLGYGTRPNAGEADGGHGLLATASQIALLDGALNGGRPGLYQYSGTSTPCEPPPFAEPGGYIGAAGEGCRADGAFVFASACTFTGAPGWGPTCLAQCWCERPSDGANALAVTAAATAAQLLGCTLAPGLGGLPNGSPCPCGIGGNFCNPNSLPGTNGLATVGPVNVLAGAARGLSGTPVAREGQLVTLTFAGQPGDRVELLQSDRTGFQFHPAARGVLLLRRTRPMLVQQVGTIGAGGTLTQTFMVGELGSGIESRIVHLQAAMIDGTNQTTLSSPAAVVLLDSAF